ncbi:MAG: hypothetical protein AAB791_00180 [Patescibacteria group bacterium]
MGAIFLAATVVYAATTIGSNIDSGGTLTVGSYASSTGGLYTQGSGHVGGALSVDGATTLSGTLTVSGLATTTGRLVLGSTNPTNNYGQLWVGGDIWSSGSATTSGTLYAGSYASSTGGLFTQGDGHIGGALTIDGNATSTGVFHFGSGTEYVNFELENYRQTGGPTKIAWLKGSSIGGLTKAFGIDTGLFIRELSTDSVYPQPTIAFLDDTDAVTGKIYLDTDTTMTFSGASAGYSFGAGATTITGNLIVSSSATTTGDFQVKGGTIDNATTSATSTVGIFARSHVTSTSTVSIGVQEDAIGGCLEMVRKSDASYFKCYISDAGAMTCEAGRCN